MSRDAADSEADPVSTKIHLNSIWRTIRESNDNKDRNARLKFSV